MKLPPAMVLGLLCFGAGWWTDARWSAGADGAGKGRTRIPAMAAKTAPAAESGSAAAAATLTESATGAAKTLSDFLALVKDVPYSTGRARAEVALGRLAVQEFAALALEMRTRFREPGAAALFPRQVLNPVLQRWLALDPLSALEFAGCAPGVLDQETVEPCYAALEKAFLADGDNVTRLLARGGHLDYFTARDRCLAAMENLPPQEALTRLMAFDARTGYEDRGDPFDSSSTAGGFVRRWMKSDPRSAMTWALAQPGTDARRRILSEMVYTWSGLENGMAEAQAFLKEIPLSVLPAGRLRENLADLAERSKLP